MTSSEATTPSWPDVPHRAPARPRRSLPPLVVDLLRVLFVAAIAVLGPADRVASVFGRGPAAMVGLIGLTLAIALRLLEARAWTVRLGAVVVASALVWTIGSHQVSFWFAIGAVLGSWAMSPPTPAPFLGVPPRSAALGIAVLCLLARHAGESDIGWQVPLVFGTLGTALLVLTARWPTALNDAGHRLGMLVSSALFALLGVVAVVVPGLARQVVPNRAFGAGSTGTSWNLLDRRSAWPERPWAPRAVERPRGSRLARLAVLVVFAVLGVAIYRVADRPADDAPEVATPTTVTVPPSAPAQTTTTGTPSGSTAANPPATAVPAAFANSPWYPKYASDSAYANTWLNLFRQAGYTKLADGGTTYMNIEDGVRRTWQPPPCSCPQVTLWFYGSATALGLGQRDDFTIPSMLAKAAWRDGIALHVVNKGVPGDQYWRQADRLAWDLAAGPPPDLVVFYTGVSDLNAAIYLNDHRLGDRDWPDDLITQSFLEDPTVQALIDKDLRGGATEAPPAPEGVALIDQARAPSLDPAQVGRLATERLARALPMGGDVARLHDVAPFWFWEPMRLNRPAVPGEPVTPDDADLRRSVAAANASVPAGMTSLADAFDGVDDPLYFDDVHHNEEGAALVADRIYLRLKPTIEDRAHGSTGSGGRP